MRSNIIYIVLFLGIVACHEKKQVHEIVPYQPLLTSGFSAQRPNVSGYGTQVVTTSSPISYPVDVAWIDSHQGFIADWMGHVYLWNLHSGALELVVDASSKVANVVNGTSNGTEEGFYSLALHPSFMMNGFVFASYARIPASGLRVVRYTYDFNSKTIDLSSEVLVVDIPTDSAIHKAGALRFKMDGTLLISVGDGGPSGSDPNNVAQSPISLRGKILRLNVDALPYTIPSNNPFIGLGTAREEIYALGMRNAWKIWIDPLTDKVWAGDVGEGSYEELNIIESGKNYGWPIYEGSLPNKPGDIIFGTHQAPFYEYDRRGKVGSITGGFIYRGSIFPDLVGLYIFGDFVQSKVWGLIFDGQGEVMERIELTDVNGLASLHEGPDGEIYMLCFNDGYLRKLIKQDAELNKIPQKLSETGLFLNVQNMTLDPAFISYQVNSPLYSDGLDKSRWIALPSVESLTYDGFGGFYLPTGAILLKHFDATLVGGERSHIETRIFVQHEEGLQGYGYVWDSDQKDATLVEDSFIKEIDIEIKGVPVRTSWQFPDSKDCMRCHNAATPGILGFRLNQLDGIVYENQSGISQIDVMKQVKLFSNPEEIPANLTDRLMSIESSGPVELRARSYLDSNCSHCHRPGGPAPSMLNLQNWVTLAETNTINQEPFLGDHGIVGAKLISPGDKEKSLVWLRLAGMAGTPMPPMGVSHVDHQAVDLIGYWIDSMVP